jgi:hypothetical protein
MILKKALLRKTLLLAVGMAMGATLASAGTIDYTCAANVDTTQAGTCSYLNSTIAGLYDSTFTNASASVYIQMGTTGLGQSAQALESVLYNTYVSALTGEGGTGVVRADAIASLPDTEPALYGGGSINLTSALSEALGLAAFGVTPSLSLCSTPGSAGCYSGIITVTTPANLSAETGGTQLLYWNQTGGAQPAHAYDFYSVVQHETDEILGTPSCIRTGSATLVDVCNFGSGASAVDLFRYQSPGTRVFESTRPGAYFSYDGGVTNGADGADYNTLANGDYADFTTNCQHVQDATGCLGSDLNITADGGSEINILDAVGYNLATATPTPEPPNMVLFVTGLLGIGLVLPKRRQSRIR